MSFGPTLYSKPLYGLNDYSMNPPLISVVDSLASTDSYVATATVLLADTLSTPSDAHVLTANVVLADMLGPADSYTIQYLAPLVDFFVTKEFIKPILRRSQQWVMGGTSRTVTPHIYGGVLYAQNMYSTNIALLWAQVKKDVTPGFTNQNGHKYNS